MAAHEEGNTLRSLVEEGLSHVFSERERRKPIPIRPVTFKGKGLSRDFEGAVWSDIRNAAYGMTSE